MTRLLTAALVFMLAFSPGDARKANEAYERGDYAMAVELYEQALQSDPENPRLHFNLGNALTRTGQAERALQAYERFQSLTDDPVETALADYNIGTLLTEAQELEMAAEYFKKALRNNPEDPDARHNYELALRQYEEQQQQQQQQDQDQNDGEDEQDQDQDQEPSHQEPDDSPPDQDRQEPDMSLEEARNILDALEQRERELLKDRKKDAREERSDNERDW